MKHLFMNKKTGAEARVLAVYLDADGAMQVDCYDKVEDLLEDYAAYEPAKPEPLIKDENTRKAVRAWAEVNLIKSVVYAERSDKTFSVLTDMGTGDYTIEFVGWIPTLKDGEVYTIDELCGKEEE